MENLPQIIYLILLFVGALIEANRHGKEKKEKHNIYTSLIASGLIFLLLYWGGFFDKLFNL